MPVASLDPAGRRRGHALAAVAVLGVLLLAAIGLHVLTAGDPDKNASPARDGVGAAGAPGEPYPYTTPVPRRTPTPVDGTYDRSLSVATAGGSPVPCRRCAPYRLEAGASTLVLDRGWFRVDHPTAGFASLGHFLVTGDRIEFFNDPNCPSKRGVYEWSVTGSSLRLVLVSDECPFDGLRARYLTAEPWSGT